MIVYLIWIHREVRTMHPSVLAYLALQRQSELLQEAETRRRRTSALRRPGTAGNRAAESGLTRWRRILITMIRPAPEPCCV